MHRKVYHREKHNIHTLLCQDCIIQAIICVLNLSISEYCYEMVNHFIQVMPDNFNQNPLSNKIKLEFTMVIKL